MKTLNNRQSEMKPRYAHTHDSLQFVLHKFWPDLAGPFWPGLYVLTGSSEKLIQMKGKQSDNGATIEII